MRRVFPLTSCSKTLKNKGFGFICLTWHCLWRVYCTRVNYTNAEGIFHEAQCSPTMTDSKNDVGHAVFLPTFLQCPGIKQCSFCLTSEVAVQKVASPSPPSTHTRHLTYNWHLSGFNQRPPHADMVLCINYDAHHDWNKPVMMMCFIR